MLNWHRIVLAGILTLTGGLLATAVHLENQDGFCASCHTEPETTYFDRSINLPADLASSHAARDPPAGCIDCHSGEGLSGRVNSLHQGVADLLTYLLSGYQQPSVAEHPIGDEACAKCHAPLKASPIRSKSHYHFASYLDEWRARAPDPLGSCGVCHPSHLEGSRASRDFVIQSRVNQACEDCHLELSGWIPPR